MNISIVSVFPELYNPFLHTSLVRRALDADLVNFDINSFSSFVPPKQRIDAPVFGPGTGMLIRPDVVQKAVEKQEKMFGKAYTIFFSPQGKQLNQRLLVSMYNSIGKMGHMLLLPARYEGMDSRVEEYYADEVISVGNFVLMGGDVPAMMLIEGMLRLVPGVVGKRESVEQDSFFGPFVDYPEYTEPVDWQNMLVPDIIRSGNHGAIEQWRLEKAVKKTVESHFEWLRTAKVTSEQKKQASEYIPSHYVALLHADVYVRPHGTIGTTSVTSLDIHDIARSCRTYAIENYFIVTPLEDQKNIVETLLDFWKRGPGGDYNASRKEAVSFVETAASIDMVIKRIEQIEGMPPLILATSAREVPGIKTISYFDQSIVWGLQRPVLIIFGTGSGLADEFIASRCDYLLLPIEGFSKFNHLSVRSAVAIVLDRWLGLNSKEG